MGKYLDPSLGKNARVGEFSKGEDVNATVGVFALSEEVNATTVETDASTGEPQVSEPVLVTEEYRTLDPITQLDPTLTTDEPKATRKSKNEPTSKLRKQSIL